jgi:hypothetical protein
MTARRARAESANDAEARDRAACERVIVEARALLADELERLRERTSVALSQSQSTALAGAAAVACSVLALGAVTTALLLAIGASAVPALVVAALALFSGAFVSSYAYLVLPSSPLEHARALAKGGFGELRRLLKPHSHSPSAQRG